MSILAISNNTSWQKLGPRIGIEPVTWKPQRGPDEHKVWLEVCLANHDPLLLSIKKKMPLENLNSLSDYVCLCGQSSHTNKKRNL